MSHFIHLVLSVSANDVFKCYQCSTQDSWCKNIDEVLDHGDEAQRICSSKKCLISGKSFLAPFNNKAVTNGY